MALSCTEKDAMVILMKLANITLAYSCELANINIQLTLMYQDVALSYTTQWKRCDGNFQYTNFTLA